MPSASSWLLPPVATDTVGMIGPMKPTFTVSRCSGSGLSRPAPAYSICSRKFSLNGFVPEKGSRSSDGAGVVLVLLEVHRRRRVGARRVDLLHHLDDLRVVERDVVRARGAARPSCLVGRVRGQGHERRARRRAATLERRMATSRRFADLDGGHGDLRPPRPSARRLRPRRRLPVRVERPLLRARVVALADPQPRPLAVPTQMSLPSTSAAIMKLCGTPDRHVHVLDDLAADRDLRPAAAGLGIARVGDPGRVLVRGVGHDAEALVRAVRGPPGRCGP